MELMVSIKGEKREKQYKTLTKDHFEAHMKVTCEHSLVQREQYTCI